MKKINTIKNNILSVSMSTWILLVVFLGFSFVISWIYFQRAVLFSFVDEFNNYVPAFFMLKGKTLYTDIFFNHQMLAPYISYVIQILLDPKSLYQMVLYHRLFVILFSFIMGALLVYRFRFVGLSFFILYELTKYYFFGYLFLGESLIIYPMVYLFGLVWSLLGNKRISPPDIILAGIFTWFIIFMREPFIPVTIVLYTMLLWYVRKEKVAYISVGLCALLSFLTVITVPLKDYLYQVITVNKETVIAYETKTNQTFGVVGILKIFFYPLYVLIDGKYSYFRIVLVSFSIIFLLCVGFLLQRKNLKKIIFTFLILALCAIRYVLPGEEFYAMYRLLPWYGLFLMNICFFFEGIYTNKKTQQAAQTMVVVSIVIIVAVIFSPNSFIWEKINRVKEFDRNYGQYFTPGEIIKTLARPNDTVFVEGWDSLIYVQADIKTAYPYILYYPIVTQVEQYVSAYKHMFATNPPDFYYVCYGKEIPSMIKKHYTIVYFNQHRTCLHIKKENVAKITKEQMEKLGSKQFHLEE